MMPQWAGSCWYELRYLDPTNEDRVRRPGGRAVLDGAADGRRAIRAASTCTSAASSTPCCTCCTPASGTRCCTTSATCRRRSRSTGCSTRATSWPRRTRTSAASTSRRPTVDERDGEFFYDGEPVTRECGKMGKSLKNAVTPDDIYDELRRRHAAPLRDVHGPARRSRGPWETARRRRHVPVPAAAVAQRGRRGDRRAARRRRRPPTTRPAALLHRTIAAVRDDMEALRFNTAIAKLIELNNHLTAVARRRARPARGRRAAGADARPARPAHRRGAVGAARPRPTRWPTSRSPPPTRRCWSTTTVEFPVQVNGKVRAQVTVAADADAAPSKRCPRATRSPSVVNAPSAGSSPCPAARQLRAWAHGERGEPTATVVIPRGYSSVGRALPWHGRGQGFDSP